MLQMNCEETGEDPRASLRQNTGKALWGVFHAGAVRRRPRSSQLALGTVSPSRCNTPGGNDDRWRSHATTSYAQIEVFANGNLAAQRFVNDKGVSDWKWDGNARCGTMFGEGYWAMEAMVSLAKLGVPQPPGGASLGFNVARASNTSASPTRYYVLSPGGMSSMHKPTFYLTAVFEKPEAKAEIAEAWLSPILPGQVEVGLRLQGADEPGRWDALVLLGTAGKQTQAARTKVAGKEVLLRFEIPVTQAGQEISIAAQLHDRQTGQVLDSSQLVKRVLPAVAQLLVDKERYWHSDANGIAAAQVNLAPRTLDEGKLAWRALIAGNVVSRGPLRKNGVGWYFPLQGVAPGEHTLVFEVLDEEGAILGRDERSFRRQEPTEAETPVSLKRLPLSFVCTGGPNRAALPITFGVPFPRGVLRGDR